MEIPSIRAADIAQTFSASKIIGDSNYLIHRVASLDTAGPNDLSYCSAKKSDGLNMMKASGAGIILCDASIPDIESLQTQKCIIIVDNPRLCFLRCIKLFLKPQIEWDIHSTAIIEPGVKLPERVSIGPMVYIGKDVEIGENTVIENRVHLGERVIIGRNVIIQAGAVLGCTGQGFERAQDGVFEKFPQLGSIVIENDVEIGANSIVVRGALAETHIGQGTKIGHLVDIGHNVHIGLHVFISAGVVVCGSATIGDFSWLSPQCCIKNKVKIGRKVTIGLGVVIEKDVPDGWTMYGVPARRIPG
jgi:UDP-3-O-[3-hydroxymyristoyl] glucosamine N-acyltransferase